LRRSGEIRGQGERRAGYRACALQHPSQNHRMDVAGEGGHQTAHREDGQAQRNDGFTPGAIRPPPERDL
jgi:hypothetical protein